MTYEITIEKRDAQPTASMRATTTPDQIGATLMELLPQVYAHLERIGARPASPPFARYHTFTPERVELEGGFVVSEPITPEDGIEANEFPAGETAVLWHVGPYTKLPDAWHALDEWLTQHHREPSTAGWELYWTDPEEEPDESKWRTEICEPLK